jgi:hypothetical protein
MCHGQNIEALQSHHLKVAEGHSLVSLCSLYPALMHPDEGDSRGWNPDCPVFTKLCRLTWGWFQLEEGASSSIYKDAKHVPGYTHPKGYLILTQKGASFSNLHTGSYRLAETVLPWPSWLISLVIGSFLWNGGGGKSSTCLKELLQGSVGIASGIW